MILLAMMHAATASPTYPNEVQSITGSPCAPSCELCHASALGGGAASRPFGQAMVARGLTGGSNLDNLDAALQAMLDEQVDTDGDGTSDVDELAVGNNPNPNDDDFCTSDGPTFGCSTTPAGSASGAMLLLVGVLGLRRRRQGSR